MKKIVFLLICLTAFLSAQDSWLGQDKWKHGSFAFMLTVQGEFAKSSVTNTKDSQSRTIPVIVFSAGLGKEIWDQKQGRVFSYKDLFVDVLGIVSAIFVLNIIKQD